MILNFDSEQPIYMQLAEAIEDDVLKGILEEDSQIPSTTEISVVLKINPATARKGVNLLVDEGILYKKRGVGMFVTPGARRKVMLKRKAKFYESYVVTLLEEATKLNISHRELVEMIERGLPDE
ncbi:MAG TPA: GntR family transcriptional regulator [Firmicutes bacterium]|nr:GntR family transcriptional regulator [Bacillota bacterium]